MKLGAYTACLHDRSLDEVLEILPGMGLTSIEVNAGGFVGRAHNVDYWADFLAVLGKVQPDVAVNIEHEDVERSQPEGLAFAAETLVRAEGKRP
jgi:sugar phosphate isomerase/epimerase